MSRTLPGRINGVKCINKLKPRDLEIMSRGIISHVIVSRRCVECAVNEMNVMVHFFVTKSLCHFSTVGSSVE